MGEDLKNAYNDKQGIITLQVKIEQNEQGIRFHNEIRCPNNLDETPDKQIKYLSALSDDLYELRRILRQKIVKLEIELAKVEFEKEGGTDGEVLPLR